MIEVGVDSFEASGYGHLILPLNQLSDKIDNLQAQLIEATRELREATSYQYLIVRNRWSAGLGYLFGWRG